jgi:hypothetical protein
VLNGRLYMFGGVLDDFDTVTGKTVSYDPAVGAGRYEESMNSASFRQQAAVLNGRLYVVGGSQTGNAPLARVERYELLFYDALPGTPFYGYIRCLACREIVSGYPDGTFRPGVDVRRGQLAKIVSNAAGFGEPRPDQTFEDVPAHSPFHPFVERLASRNIVGGYACGGAGEPCVPPVNRPYFRPNAEVTRGQTSKMVATAAGLPTPPAGQWTFYDVPQGSTFWQWVEALAGNGAIGGYACGGAGEPCDSESRAYFRPHNNVTRGQASKIVANTFFPGCAAP